MTPKAGGWYAAVSDIGRVRDHNEDSVLAEPPLFVVADGLGGHEAGEVASSLAVETLRDNAPRRPDAKALARAVRAANREVIRAAREGIGRQGMGTTLTAAIVEGTHIAVAHVGDSRAYLIRDGSLSRVTEDHSMVADMVRRGTITEEESRYHPNRSVITRALGTDPNMIADTYEVDAEPGDILLLASDGLTGMVEDADIAAVVQRNADDLGQAASSLVETANAAGGHDNISVVLVRMQGGAPSDRRTGEATAAGAARRPGVSRGVVAVALWVIAFAVIVGGIGFATYRYASTRAYVTNANGMVAVFRGVPGEFLGVRLSWPQPATDVLVADLQPVDQTRVNSTPRFDSVSEADRFVERLRNESVTPSTTPTALPEPNTVPTTTP